MKAIPTRKNKINLSDYDFRRDIDNRIAMSSFSVFEVNVLEEILHSSVKIPIEDLVAEMHVSKKKLLPVLHKLSEIGLLTYDDRLVIVNKEMRKYYELQIDKFDDDFEPGIAFLQRLLGKVPIHILPTWYAIPRMSDNIFASIIEKSLLTPKIYRRYLEELQVEDPVLSGIINDVFSAPDFKVRSRTLKKKYHLSREQFEEHLLNLEFSLVCCLSYTRVDDMWKEVVTPFHEWREFLRFDRDSIPQPISAPSKVVRRHPKDFGFVEALTVILKEAKKKDVLVEQKDDQLVLPTPLLRKMFRQPTGGTVSHLVDEGDHVLKKVLLIRLAKLSDGRLSLLSQGEKWLALSTADKAMALYRHPQNKLAYSGISKGLITDRNLRLAEKSLRRVVDGGWVDFDAFLEGVIQPIGTAKGVTLQKVSRGRWQYVRPSYIAEEREFLRLTIFERLFEVGVVATGTYRGKPCFQITPFGKSALGA